MAQAQESPETTALRVVVACEQPLVCDAVRAALASLEVEVVAVRWPGEHGVRRVGRRVDTRVRPHAGLLLSDLATDPERDAARLLVRRVAVPWLVITAAPRGPLWGAMLEAGALAVQPSSAGVEEIVAALAGIARGETELPATLREQLTEEWAQLQLRHERIASGLRRLTPREREVLGLLYAGESVAQIAELLEVSPATVRSQVKSVLRKLEVNSQLGAVAALGSVLRHQRLHPAL